MFTIGLSGRRFINHYPEMFRELDEVSVHDGWSQFRKFTGEKIGEPVPFGQATGGDASLGWNELPMVTQIRPLFHAMLYHQIARFNIPVSYGRRVVEYYEDPPRGIAGVKTESGDCEEAGIVIAADGLHSYSHDVVLGGQSKPQPSGRSIFRAAWDLDLAMKDPLVAKEFGLKDGKYPVFQAWAGPETHCMCLTYVDKYGKNGRMLWGLNFVESPEQQSMIESWHQTVSSAYVIDFINQNIPGYAESMKALIRTMPEGRIVFWPLLPRDPNPCVHSKGGRILQVGDAAHAFLPTSGNGATQAIEDGVTIAACLQHAGKDNVPLAVKTHALLRGDRVSCCQLLGFYNAERLQKTDMKTVGNNEKGAGKVKPKVPKFIFQHDPEKYANENFEKAAASLQGGAAFHNTNIPPGYKPEPWTMAGIEQLYKEGKQIELLGDWS